MAIAIFLAFIMSMLVFLPQINPVGAFHDPGHASDLRVTGIYLNKYTANPGEQITVSAYYWRVLRLYIHGTGPLSISDGFSDIYNPSQLSPNLFYRINFDALPPPTAPGWEATSSQIFAAPSQPGTYAIVANAARDPFVPLPVCAWDRLLRWSSAFTGQLFQEPCGQTIPAYLTVTAPATLPPSCQLSLSNPNIQVNQATTWSISCNQTASSATWFGPDIPGGSPVQGFSNSAFWQATYTYGPSEAGKNYTRYAEVHFSNGAVFTTNTQSLSIAAAPVVTPPTASLSGPTFGIPGDSLTYQAIAQGQNLRQLDILKAAQGTDLRLSTSWTVLASVPCSGQTCSNSVTWIPGLEDVGKIWIIVVNAYDANGTQCSGNTQTSSPSFWSKCNPGNTDTVLTTVPIIGAGTAAQPIPPDQLPAPPPTEIASSATQNPQQLYKIRLIGAEIFINTKPYIVTTTNAFLPATWYSGNEGAIPALSQSLRYTLAHEFGHALGLCHTHILPEVNLLMSPLQLPKPNNQIDYDARDGYYFTHLGPDVGATNPELDYCKL